MTEPLTRDSAATVGPRRPRRHGDVARHDTRCGPGRAGVAAAWALTAGAGGRPPRRGATTCTPTRPEGSSKPTDFQARSRAGPGRARGGRGTPRRRTVGSRPPRAHAVADEGAGCDALTSAQITAQTGRTRRNLTTARSRHLRSSVKPVVMRPPRGACRGPRRAGTARPTGITVWGASWCDPPSGLSGPAGDPGPTHQGRVPCSSSTTIGVRGQALLLLDGLQRPRQVEGRLRPHAGPLAIAWASSRSRPGGTSGRPVGGGGAGADPWASTRRPSCRSPGTSKGDRPTSRCHSVAARE